MATPMSSVTPQSFGWQDVDKQVFKNNSIIPALPMSQLVQRHHKTHAFMKGNKHVDVIRGEEHPVFNPAYYG